MLASKQFSLLAVAAMMVFAQGINAQAPPVEASDCAEACLDSLAPGGTDDVLDAAILQICTNEGVRQTLFGCLNACPDGGVLTGQVQQLCQTVPSGVIPPIPGATPTLPPNSFASPVPGAIPGATTTTTSKTTGTASPTASPSPTSGASMISSSGAGQLFVALAAGVAAFL
ncbi:hypothetical protein HK102_008169 [Quaeritorhiza haematococci]|nr:hypothetical protein HK102_008169 [Quaeritorhiza haematococci]